MGDYLEFAKTIPWKSLGRETTTSRLGKSLVPVGVMPFKPLPYNPDGTPYISNEHPDMEKFLMNIIGTAIQADKGKLVTCLHVADAINKQPSDGYLFVRLVRNEYVKYTPYPIEKSLRYVDPRTNKVNFSVDLAVIISTAKSIPELPYDVPPVEWGDSSNIGVGDPVVVGGFPHGTEMFKFTQSNRGLVQPTFYHGIVSAILPVMKTGETRLIQLSVPCAGGMSGGAVFCPKTGKVLGMLTSCIHTNSIPQPMSYAIPSEVIEPYVNTITFKTKS